MTGSSQNHNEAFAGVKWRQVKVLLSILNNAALLQKNYVERRYKEKEPSFHETMEFVKALGVVGEDGGKFVVSKSALQAYFDNPVVWVVDRLRRSVTRYRSDFEGYLSQFVLAEGEVIDHPTASTRHTNSHVRNFLMEMRIVSHDWASDVYRIAPEYIGLYALARESEAIIPPEICKSRLQRKEELGTAAEKAVIDYEIHRVGEAYADRVLHVALRNTNAGYDIRSVTFTDSGNTVPRCIEVKAVSKGSMRFFWTRNEMSVAQILSDSYWLYLLPVSSKGTFALEDLYIIRDAYTSIILNPDTWEIETDAAVCSIREEPQIENNT
jgi:hypothetical protein